MTETEKTAARVDENNWGAEIGKPAYEGIAEMVAALECDYDRLQELREAFVSWRDEALETAETEGRLPMPTPTVEDWAVVDEDGEELKELTEAAGECSDREEAETRIQEDPLDITIRGEKRNGEWEADEFTILLSTGGPAVRIVGDLDGHGEPRSPRLEVQDWFKPWTEYVPAAHSVLLEYCRQFVFAE